VVGWWLWVVARAARSGGGAAGSQQNTTAGAENRAVTATNPAMAWGKEDKRAGDVLVVVAIGK